VAWISRSRQPSEVSRPIYTVYVRVATYRQFIATHIQSIYYALQLVFYNLVCSCVVLSNLPPGLKYLLKVLAGFTAEILDSDAHSPMLKSVAIGPFDPIYLTLRTSQSTAMSNRRQTNNLLNMAYFSSLRNVPFQPSGPVITMRRLYS